MIPKRIRSTPAGTWRNDSRDKTWRGKTGSDSFAISRIMRLEKPGSHRNTVGIALSLIAEDIVHRRSNVPDVVPMVFIMVLALV
ncbi:hypothetical protein M8J76_016852 [Diaphorina citri]|nr:hypothetical protein M8J76_016852 [Diaphorina citri]